MPESSYGFNEGTARRQHTIQHTVGGTAVEDMVVAQGLASLATYTVTVSAVDMATANMHLLQIMAGASNRIGIRRILVTQRANAGAASVGQFALFRLTSAGTGGTASTVAPLDTADTAGGTARHGIASSLGTETGVALWRQSVSISNSVASLLFTTVIDWQFGDGGLSKLLWVAAGTANGIALKSITAVGTATLDIAAEFVEVAYS